MQTKTEPSTRGRRGLTAEGSQRREYHVKSEMSRRSSQTNMIREESRGKRRRQSTQLQLLFKRHWTDTVRKMRIASVENNTLNWVSNASAGALDMTNRDFSARSAQDEMRHFVGSSELDVIIVSDQDQNRRCKKNDKKSLEIP